MSYEYEITFSLNLANALPEVKDLNDRLNRHLATMGVDETIRLGFNQPLLMCLTVEREPTDQEIAKMTDIITGQLCLSFAGANPKCVSFRRKPGHVSQSALQ